MRNRAFDPFIKFIVWEDEGTGGRMKEERRVRGIHRNNEEREGRREEKR